MNDQPHDSISDDLAAVADDIDVGDADAMLTAVRGAATARRRRRSAVLGVAAVGTLAVSGIVLANVVSDDGSADVLLSADSVPTSTEAPADVDTAPPTVVPVVPATVPAATGEPIPVQVVPANSILTSDPAFESEADFGNAPQLFAWQDGFLAVRRDFEPQPLPTELPPEIVEQFSPEVVEFFADGLPPTIDEAIAQLEEAGLLDEVTAVVTSNPDVFDAIYATPTEVTVSVRFSTDGVEWSDVDANFPDELSQSYNVSVAGDRLVIVSDGREVGPEGRSEASGEMTVLSSTDLVEWSRQTIPLPAAPTDLPDFVRVDTYPENLVANADRWMLRISTFSDVDILSLVDDDLRDRVQNGSGGYGMSSDADGITIEIYEPQEFEPNGDEPLDTTAMIPNEPTEQIRFTWNELGLDGEPDNLNEQSSVAWTSDWVGAPVASTEAIAGESDWYRTTTAVDAGFVTAARDGVLFSADGITWSSVDAPVEGYIDNLVPVGDEVVAFVTGVDGTTSQHQLDISTMTWTTIVIDGLPESFGVERSVNGAATLYENDSAGFGAGPTTSVGTAEVNGFLVELRRTFFYDSGGATYTVTDIASGEVVSTESSDDVVSEESPFEFAEESYDVAGEEGITFFDPATGEQMVKVPFEAMDYVVLDADGQPIPEQNFPDSEPSIPSRWMLATNGSSWIVEQLSEASSADTEEAYFGSEIGDVAVNGDTVLISKFDGTFLRYDLA